MSGSLFEEQAQVCRRLQASAKRAQQVACWAAQISLSQTHEWSGENLFDLDDRYLRELRMVLGNLLTASLYIRRICVTHSYRAMTWLGERG